MRKRRLPNGNILIPESNVQSTIITFLTRARLVHNRVNGAQMSVPGKTKSGNPSTRRLRCNSMNGKSDIEVWTYAENSNGEKIGIPLYIEVKKSEGGKQSTSQKDFETMLAERGFYYILASSLKEAYNGMVKAQIDISNKIPGFVLNIGRLKV